MLAENSLLNVKAKKKKIGVQKSLLNFSENLYWFCVAFKSENFSEINYHQGLFRNYFAYRDNLFIICVHHFDITVLLL